MMFFYEISSCTLAYTSQTYAECVDMQPDVTYTPYATPSRGETGDIITFAHLEEGDLLSETCNDTESNNKYDNYSTRVPLVSEE